MATHEDIKPAIIECLKGIGQESNIKFDEYDIETQTGGTYQPDTWTYKILGRRVSLEYWFSSFSSRKEEKDITFGADGNKEKLESDLRECLGKLRETVKRKKGMF